MPYLIYALIAIVFILIVLSIILFFGMTDIHFHKNPSEDKIRVACVGDSITNGFCIPGCFFNSYPSQLQNILGEKYHVENYGLNGRNLQSSCDRPYTLENEFRKSVEFNPDIVVIMLGTNDTKMKYLFSKTRFTTEYRSFIKKYADLPCNPRIILCTPCWQKNPINFIQRFSNDTREEGIAPIAEIIKNIGSEDNIPVIDFHELFTDRLDLLNFDWVHPNIKGASIIAKKVSKLIKIIGEK